MQSVPELQTIKQPANLPFWARILSLDGLHNTAALVWRSRIGHDIREVTIADYLSSLLLRQGKNIQCIPGRRVMNIRKDRSRYIPWATPAEPRGDGDVLPAVNTERRGESLHGSAEARLPQSFSGVRWKVHWRGSNWCRRRDSNSRPRDYETLALPLSYAGQPERTGYVKEHVQSLSSKESGLP